MNTKRKYQKIYDVYIVTDADEQKKFADKIRPLAKRLYNKKYEELTEYEELQFITEDLKSTMTTENSIRKCTDDMMRNIQANIDNMRKNSPYIVADHAIDEYNKSVKDFHKPFYCKDDTIEQKEVAYSQFQAVYEKFCKECLNPNTDFNIPTFEEWLDDNKKLEEIDDNDKAPNHYLTLYDYYSDYTANKNYTQYVPSQAEIDHVVLQVVMNLFKDIFDIEINVKEIEQSLIAMNTSGMYDNLTEFEELSSEDNQLQEKSRQLMRFKTELNNAEFYDKQIARDWNDNLKKRKPK